MSAVTITITDDTGKVTQPDDIQYVGTIALFRDRVAVAASIGAKPLRRLEADLGLAWS